MRVPVEFAPGLNGDDTTYAASGRWADASNVRFHRGRPQVIGGWESLTGDLLSGVCRTVFNWSDNTPTLNIGFGTHTHLQVWVGGGLYDITPTLERPSATLRNPFTVADGSTLVTVTQNGHGLETGASVIVTGVVAVGRIVPNGTFAIAKVDDNSYTYTFTSPADLAETLGNNPLSVTSGQAKVTVTDTAHGLADGTSITVSGATAVGGITPNGTFPITVIDANSYSYTFTSNATSTATGGGAAVVVTVPATGGGTAVVVAPQVAFTTGAVDGTGGAGYGTGTYSTGAYSEPSTADYFPRTWALGAWGQNLLANPRGGTIYAWENDTSVHAAPLLNAPADVSHMVVAPQDMVFALGCNEEVSGRFNPLCIRHSSVRRNTEWATGSATTAREYILPGGGRIVGGRVIGPYLLVWTSHSLFLGTYVGALNQVWRFDRVGEKCGLIGPNAAVVVGQAAFWIGPDLQFYRYSLGGAAQSIECPIRESFASNLTPSQADKIVASSTSTFSEVRWDYPDAREGTENSRYMLLSLKDGSWSRGIMARSAFVDAGPSEFPIGVTPQGVAFWHERGQSADGGAFSWFLRSADAYLDENNITFARGLWPDLADQIGPVNVTLTTRLVPQGDTRTFGPYTMAVGEDRVDFRASGRLFNIEFSGSSAPTSARLGKIAFDLVAAGKR